MARFSVFMLWFASAFSFQLVRRSSRKQWHQAIPFSTKPINSHTNIIEHTKSWIGRWVIANGLCPWAAGVYNDVASRYRVDIRSYNDNTSAESILAGVLGEAQSLASSLSSSNTVHQTTFIILSNIGSFDDYLALHADAETLLSDSGLDQDVQIATFHPQYQFDGCEPTDVENFTNRSPYPMLHLLSTEQVSKAIESMDGETESIWQRNVSLMRRLGIQRIQQMHEEIKATVGINDDTKPVKSKLVQRRDRSLLREDNDKNL